MTQTETRECSTPFCREPGVRSWGIDQQPMCPAHYAETQLLLAALRQETGTTETGEETE